ncbi:uncharacterized protein [Henckelia pumila]|uniref:uncharacterized protein n=1 Tax=Henckelia pumila TaxID=405737 RepID=UPI003C6E93B2
MRDDDILGPKPRAQWTTDENTAAIYNAKALNAIFTSVDMNIFNLIGTCVCARDAWKKLQTHREGSASVKKTRMRLITSKFKKMRMEESDIIMDYNGRLKSLANEESVLGDPISNERLVSKVLRSVPKRFHTKVCAIDESKDTSIMSLDELISSLRTYEMEMEAEDDTKGMNVSLSDDDSEGEHEKVEHVDLIYFTALLEGKKYFQINSLGVGSGVATPGRNTIQKSVCFVASNHNNFSDLEEQLDSRRIEVIMSKKDLELGLLNSELEKPKATLARFNSSSNKLYTLLTMGKNDKFGLGFKESVFETGESSKTPVFVKECSDSLNHPSAASKGKKPIVQKNVSVQKPKQWKRPFVCHYCLKPGHIRPFCHKLKNDYLLWEYKQVLPPVLHNTKRNTGKKRPTAKKIWVPKSDGLKEHLTDYIEQNGGRLTYGGGAKGRIVGKGTLNVEGFPKLHNFLHVEGLNANLISISTRSVDNCYQLGEELACRHSKVDEFSLWHQNLGHVNFKTLKNLSKFEAARGLPNLKSGIPYVCGACQKDLKEKTAEDDIEVLRENPREEHSVVPDVTTPNTILVPPEIVHEENSQSNEETEVDSHEFQL